MKLPRRNFLHLAASAAALPVVPRIASAQSYPTPPYLRLYFTVRDPVSGASHSIEQEIRLTTTRPRLGGARWWFVCPQSGARVGRLHLPAGSMQFAARRAPECPAAIHDDLIRHQVVGRAHQMLRR